MNIYLLFIPFLMPSAYDCPSDTTPHRRNLLVLASRKQRIVERWAHSRACRWGRPTKLETESRTPHKWDDLPHSPECTHRRTRRTGRPCSAKLTTGTTRTSKK